MTTSPLVEFLRSPTTIRTHSKILFELCEKNNSDFFTLNFQKWDGLCDFVLSTTRKAYPDLNVPYHSRLRHFEVGGYDRLLWFKERWPNITDKDWGRFLYELIIVSVLLDAGAGAKWSFYEERTKTSYSRSEGLAVASLHLFLSDLIKDYSPEAGLTPELLLRSLNEAPLRAAFQVTQQNPMTGFEGRAALIASLAKMIQSHPQVFTTQDGKIRLGALFDTLVSQATDNQPDTASPRHPEPFDYAQGKLRRGLSPQTLEARLIFKTVLETFANVWPPRLSMDGENLGDVWGHPKIQSDGKGFVPFHKLSQWLTYSLIEPLENFGIRILSLDDLTGLPEYRNGGLFLDWGVLKLKNPKNANQSFTPDHPLIVEWRALTVILLDRLADSLRKKLGLTADELPLAKILQGGTWTCGRLLAFERSPEGSPPLQIISDGTVF